MHSTGNTGCTGCTGDETYRVSRGLMVNSQRDD